MSHNTTAMKGRIGSINDNIAAINGCIGAINRGSQTCVLDKVRPKVPAVVIPARHRLVWEQHVLRQYRTPRIAYSSTC
eukprot:2746304-Rhodomonas_salina.5